MRQGNQFRQWVTRDSKGQAVLKLPLELEHEWQQYITVVWVANGDGTYTLVPSKEL